MENLQAYSLTDSDFIPQRDIETTEWFEDASSNADWIDNYSDPISTCSLTEEPYALNTYESLHQRNKSLEEKWQDIEQKYENLLRDRDRQSLHLLHEQEKVMKYQKKLQFIKSNSDVVNKLKEKYLSVKGIKSKPVSERAEKACQTNGQDPNGYEKDVIVVVKRSELQVMKETLAKLKMLVDTHTIAYSNAERNKHETEIRQLHNTISHLKDTISKKSYYLDIQKQSTVERKTFESVQKENENLRRILVKMGRRQREQYFSVNSVPVLNDEENVLVQNLLQIYHQDKPKPNPKPTRQRSPALKVKSSSDRSSNSDGNETKDIGAFGNTPNANVIPVITLPNNSSGDKNEFSVGHKKRYLET